MAWTVEYDETARSQLQRLDRQTAHRITAYMDAIGALDDPRQRGRALSASFTGFWRYRVGDYRVICDIQDEVLRILVITVGHRGQVYR